MGKVKKSIHHAYLSPENCSRLSYLLNDGTLTVRDEISKFTHSNLQAEYHVKELLVVNRYHSVLIRVVLPER